MSSSSHVKSTSVAAFPVSATVNESMNFDHANKPGTFPHGLRQKLDSAHSAFLDYRHQGMKHLAGMILQEMGANHGASSNGSATSGSLETEVIPSSKTSPQFEKSRIKPPGVIFDHQDLLEFAVGQQWTLRLSHAHQHAVLSKPMVPATCQRRHSLQASPKWGNANASHLKYVMHR